MVTEIEIGAEVICQDGVAGHCAAVIVDPTRRRLTHIVVSGRRGAQHLIPVGSITRAEDGRVRLECHRVDIQNGEPYWEWNFVRGNEGLESLVAPPLNLPVFRWPHTPLQHRVKEGMLQDEIAMDHDTRVEGPDGYVGRVDGFALDPSDGRITHMLVRTKRFPARDISVPVTSVVEMRRYELALQLARRDVNGLPHVPPDQLDRLPGLDQNDRSLVPERPSAAGLDERDADGAHREAAHVLGDAAHERLAARGFTAGQILEWAEAYLQAEGSGGVDEFIEWIEQREHIGHRIERPRWEP